MPVVATIVELDATRRQPVGQPMNVDFNPQSLRLTHAATGPTGAQGGSSTAPETTTTPRQVTGYTTTLSTELLFDTSRSGSDVRDKTQVLVTLARPQATESAAGRIVRFSWGSFLFVGTIDSLGETIDLFSDDGVPLRATVSLSMRGLAELDSRPAGGGFGAGLSAGASIGAGLSAGIGIGASASFGASASAGASFGASASAGASFGAGLSAGASATVGVGTTPLTLTASGDSIQTLAARAGVSWKAVASANGIDNPRLVPPGTIIDLRVSTT